MDLAVKKAFLMLYERGYSVKDIAEQIGLSKATVNRAISDVGELGRKNRKACGCVLCPKHLEWSMARSRIRTETRSDVFGKSAGRCARCKIAVERRGFEIDHIIPVHAGGKSNPDNLQVLCIRCHKAKTKEDRSVVVWARQYA